MGEVIWNSLDFMEKRYLYMVSHKQVTTAELAKNIERSGKTVGTRLNRLIDLNIIKRNGSLTNPKQTYEMI